MSVFISQLNILKQTKLKIIYNFFNICSKCFCYVDRVDTPVFTSRVFRAGIEYVSLELTLAVTLKTCRAAYHISLQNHIDNHRQPRHKISVDLQIQNLYEINSEVKS